MPMLLSCIVCDQKREITGSYSPLELFATSKQIWILSNLRIVLKN